MTADAARAEHPSATTRAAERPSTYLFHRITGGQSLAEILDMAYPAGALKPSPEAIMAANPHAFRNANPNALISGQTLSLPLYSGQFGTADPADRTGPSALRAAQQALVPSAPVAGAVESLSGILLASWAGQPARVLTAGAAVHERDRLVLRNGRAKLRLLDGSQIFLQDGTDMVIEALQFRDDETNRGQRVLGLAKGGLRMISGLLKPDRAQTPEDTDIRTPVALIGVRGTDTKLHFCAAETCAVEGGTLPAGLTAGLFNGDIVIDNAAGTAGVSPEQVFAVASRDSAPRPAPELRCALLGLYCDVPEQAACRTRLSAKLHGHQRRVCVAD